MWPARTAIPLLLVLLAAGCGDQALVAHAKAAQASREILVGAQNVVREERFRRLQEAALAEDVTVEQARTRVAEIQAEWDPVVAGLNAAIVAHNVWVDSLLAAVGDEEYETQTMLRLAVDLIQMWSVVVELGQALDPECDIPAPPQFLLGLTGGGS